MNSDFAGSIINVAGLLVIAGNVYTYFDEAASKNQPWPGPQWKNGLADVIKNTNWKVHLNMNIEYYF